MAECADETAYDKPGAATKQHPTVSVDVAEPTAHEDECALCEPVTFLASCFLL